MGWESFTLARVTKWNKWKGHASLEKDSLLQDELGTEELMAQKRVKTGNFLLVGHEGLCDRTKNPTFVEGGANENHTSWEKNILLNSLARERLKVSTAVINKPSKDRDSGVGNI